MSCVVEIEHLTYAYPDGHPALSDVSLNLAHGEKAAIVGPNGAGKSTLLLHLNGILPRQTGELRVSELDVSGKNLGRVRALVGLVFQQPDDQLFSPTVFDDVAFLKHDNVGMQRAVAEAQGKSLTEDEMSQRQGSVLAYSGHLQQARKASRHAIDLARQASQRGREALFETGAAVWEAFLGDATVARQGALAALALSQDRDVEYGAAFALALSGDSSRAQARRIHAVKISHVQHSHGRAARRT